MNYVRPDPLTPFAHTSGPRNAKIALVGEAFGEQEDMVGLPFQGQSGQELTRLLEEAGIARRDCFLTNFIPLRPPSNNFDLFCAKKKEVGGKDYHHEPLGQGKYLRPEFLPHIQRLKHELEAVNPNIVIPLGAKACWALFGVAKIGALRGTVAIGNLCPRLKLLPTYHPAALFRNWSLRPIVVADLLKAARQSEFPDIRRPARWVLIDPTFDEIHAWIEKHLARADEFAVDIETSGGMITCIGFAPNPRHALVIPFLDRRKPDGHYWPTLEDEIAAWKIVRYILEELPGKKVFQNGLYDLQYIVQMAILPRDCEDDTMLLHHSIYPELQKSLGFLGSIYTDEASWKLMRENKEELKRDE